MEAKYILFFILINVHTIRTADSFNEPSKISVFGTIIRNPKDSDDRLLDLKNRNKFCDAEIVVGNERIPVHKIILATSSEYIEKVFTDDESRAEIKLKNIDVEIVRSLIEYCYTGIISVSKKKMREIMSAAGFSKISQIVKGCEKIIEKKMDSSNCISTWKLAQTEYFKNDALECVRQNYEKISRSPEFLDLDYSEILELIKSEIAVTSETIVFNSVKKWINHNSASRKQYLDELSEFIKFEYLPRNILLSESHDFCSDNSSYQCHAKIVNTLQQREKNNFESDDNSFRMSYSTLMAVGSHEFLHEKTFDIFDLRNEKWIRIENFKCDRLEHSAVLLEDKILMIGGRYYGYLNTVDSYDLSTGKIKNLPPMIYERENFAAIEFKGRVYVIGGSNKSPYLPYVEMWDPVLKTWKELSSMSIPRHGCKVGVLNEEILVVGGRNRDGFLSDVESYNPVTDTWRKRASMNEGRYYPAVAVVGGYLYVVGGKYSKTAERYDPTFDKWTMIHSLNETRHKMSAANLFGKLVVVGGWTYDLRKEPIVEMYDDENNNWISMPSLTEPTTDLKLVEIPWRLAKALPRVDSTGYRYHGSFDSSSKYWHLDTL